MHFNKPSRHFASLWDEAPITGDQNSLARHELLRLTAILQSMTPHPIPVETTSQQPAMAVRTWSRRFAIAMLQVIAWGIFAAIGALTSLNDDLRTGFNPDYWPIFVAWVDRAIAMGIISVVIWYGFGRWPKVYASGRNLILGFGLLLLGLLPLQLLFVFKDLLMSDSQLMSWQGVGDQLKLINYLASLLQITSVAAIYLAVAAIKLWQQNQDRRRRWEQERADMLALKLELEQQRMLALRAQLEPHFMFNALNAISALVMQDNKENALDGINGLSELLRYALTASDKNWVKFADEMQFIEDYLQLQTLRYGARLQFQCEGYDAEIAQIPCPPLMLQPLVENAIRHDLDTHHDRSDIHLHFALNEEQLHITLNNPIHHEGQSSNPGAGLGLRNIRDRLAMAYGDKASLMTKIEENRFWVVLQLPTNIDHNLH